MTKVHGQSHKVTRKQEKQAICSNYRGYRISSRQSRDGFKTQKKICVHKIRCLTTEFLSAGETLEVYICSKIQLN